MIAVINYSGQAWELGCTVNLVTEDGPVYHTLSVHLSRTKLKTRSDDRYTVAKFSNPEFWTKFQREVPLFLELPEFPVDTV